jgi:hypothetical protein
VSDTVMCGSTHRHRQKLDKRLLRHFILLAAETPKEVELNAIFRSRSKNHMHTACAVDLFVCLQETTKASPSAPHYSLTCHDLENLARRVVSNRETNIFVYECCRVFGDRFDRRGHAVFDEILNEKLKKHKIDVAEPSSLVSDQTLLFHCFAKNV